MPEAQTYVVGGATIVAQGTREERPYGFLIGSERFVYWDAKSGTWCIQGGDYLSFPAIWWTPDFSPPVSQPKDHPPNRGRVLPALPSRRRHRQRTEGDR